VRGRKGPRVGKNERKKRERRRFKINTCSVASLITGISPSLHLQETPILLQGLRAVKYSGTVSRTQVSSGMPSSGMRRSVDPVRRGVSKEHTASIKVEVISEPS
jgi:hypothetical protein